MVDTIQIAWVAGFLEGEGSFTHRKKKASEIEISVSQVQREPLERLVALFGGILFLYHPKTKGHQPIWRWGLVGSRAAQVMMTVYALMSPRRKGQIEVALKFWRMSLPERRYLGSPYCLRGHVLSDVGLTKRGRCRKCRKMEDANYYKRKVANAS